MELCPKAEAWKCFGRWIFKGRIKERQTEWGFRSMKGMETKRIEKDKDKDKKNNS